MRAWAVDRPGPMGSRPLRMVERPEPVPRPGEVLVRVEACGVCRTDLHLAEGDLPPHRPLTTPGHEVVGGRALGPGPTASVGDRVGVAWLRSTCGSCRYCRRGRENLCPAPTYTGWDADGGYAEHADGRPRRTPTRSPRRADERLAPLLCAGIIGYRALRRGDLPPGGRLGVYGFGASAHLTAQVAIAQGARRARADPGGRAPGELALELGAASAGRRDGRRSRSTRPSCSRPAGELVPVALAALDRGGTLAVAGIHLSDVPSLNYDRHLFQERHAAQRHREHPRGRPRLPGSGTSASARGTQRPLRLRGR